jgi:phospholipase C
MLSAGCGGSAGPSAAIPVDPSPPPAPASQPSIKHVVIVVEENKDYGQVVGSSNMPFLNSLITQYALATNYYANGTDSLPNYFMMTVGDTVTTGATYNDVVTADNVVRELSAAGKTWKAYAESLPSVGYLGSDQPPYVKVHNPFAYFTDVVNDSNQAQNIVGIDQFATDLAADQLPAYSFVVPNDNSNSHDCPPNMTTCSTADTLTYSDNWLKAKLQPLLDSSAWANTLLIITYDESAGDTTQGGGHVATVLAGPYVKGGYKIGTAMQHQSLLRLSMKALGVTKYPGQAATAPDMDDAFTIPLVPSTP